MTKYRAWIRGKYQDSRGTLYLLSKNIQFPLNSRNETVWNGIAFGSEHLGGANSRWPTAQFGLLPKPSIGEPICRWASKDGRETAQASLIFLGSHWAIGLLCVEWVHSRRPSAPGLPS